MSDLTRRVRGSAKVKPSSGAAAMVGLCALGMCGLSGGCQIHSNARLEVGSSLRLPATDLVPGAQRQDQSNGIGEIAQSEDPSIVASQVTPLRPTPASLDRSDWARREFHVPYDGVRHYPSHTRQFVPAYAHRSTGRSPSLLSALDLGNASYGMGVAEGVGNLGVALFDAIVLVPEHFVFDPFWEENQSPQWAGERVPMRSWVGEILSVDVPPGQSLSTMRMVARPASQGDDTSEIEPPASPPDTGVSEGAAPPVDEPTTGEVSVPATGEGEEPTSGAEPGSGGT